MYLVAGSAKFPWSSGFTPYDPVGKVNKVGKSAFRHGLVSDFNGGDKII
jgi:hypothetical protein